MDDDFDEEAFWDHLRVCSASFKKMVIKELAELIRRDEAVSE